MGKNRLDRNPQGVSVKRKEGFHAGLDVPFDLDVPSRARVQGAVRQMDLKSLAGKPELATLKIQLIGTRALGLRRAGHNLLTIAEADLLTAR
jgi:hypothetical protein